MPNNIVEAILKKGYQFPTVPMIGSEYKELYKLEDKRNSAVRAATEELAEVLGHESGDYFKKTVGESLYSILDNYESNVSILVCVEYLKRQGIEIKDTE
jgi:hypothetical protein